MLYSDTTNLLLNLKMLYDATFLRDGHFTNVSLGDTVDSVDVSQLILDAAESGYGTQVWQSPYQEWVYESGITMNDAPFVSDLTPPYQASGIYVNGAFYLNGEGVSGVDFYIDYINGRVHFDSAIPADSEVKAEYSFRHFRVDLFNKYTIPDISYHTDAEYKDNPWSNNNIEYPTGADRIGMMPAVFIEVGDGDSDIYELGNRSRIKLQVINCHVYAQNQQERDAAIDLIDSRWHMFMPFVDFNYAPLPLSGIVNTLSPAYIPYQTLLENVEYDGNTVISKHFEFEEVRTRGTRPLSNLERGIAENRIKIYNIAPTGRIEPNPFI